MNDSKLNGIILRRDRLNMVIEDARGIGMDESKLNGLILRRDRLNVVIEDAMAARQPVSAKDDATKTIEAFIENRIGAFQADLVTSTDAANTLRTGELVTPELMHCEGKIFTPAKVGKLLKWTSDCARLRACRGKQSVRLWAVRDCERYQIMSMTQVYDEYDRMVQLARAATPLTVLRKKPVCFL